MHLSLRQIPAAVNNRAIASLQFRYYNSFNNNVKRSKSTGISGNRVSNFADTGLFCASGYSTLTRSIPQGIFIQEQFATHYSTVSFSVLILNAIFN